MSTEAHPDLVRRRRSSRVSTSPLGLGVVIALGAAGVLTAAGCDDGKVVTTTTLTKGIVSPAVAILANDYKISSLSLYNPSTGKLVDACVTSATTSATLTQKLSGDVVLPSQPQTGGEVVLIDREAAVLTFVKPDACEARGQLSVSTGGFPSNPHDVVTLSATKAYVSRYATNAAATVDPADFDEGDDILIVDPKQLAVTGRIALGAYATPGPAGEPTFARPDRAVFAGGLVYVSLNSIDVTFGAVGAGRVVVIDPAADAVVSTIELPDQKDCSGLTYVAATNRLYVSCGGAFSESASQVAESALVEVDLSGAVPAIARVLPAATLATGSLAFFSPAIFGDAAFVATMGAYPDFMTGAPATSDVYYFAPLGGGAPSKLIEGAAGDLGAALVDPASKRVFLSDGNATKPMMRAFDATTGAAVPTADFEPNPSTHLSPRDVAWY